MSKAGISAALRLLLLVLLTVGFLILARTTALGPAMEELTHRTAAIRNQGWAALAYMSLYAVGLGVGLPGTALTLVGGATFGMWPGLAINFVGALAGCSLAFFEARFLGRDLLLRFLDSRRARAVAATTTELGEAPGTRLGELRRPKAAFLTFARLRLVPFVPLNATNFAAGLTHAPYRSYLAGTALGIVPSTAVWTHFASTLSMQGGAMRQAAELRLGIALLALCLLSFVPAVVSRLRRPARARGRGADPGA